MKNCPPGAAKVVEGVEALDEACEEEAEGAGETEVDEADVDKESIICGMGDSPMKLCGGYGGGIMGIPG